MLTLYDYPRSTAAYRVRIALQFKGLDYQSENVHLIKDGGEQHKADFKAINPQALVPVLKDGDVSISQSLAIIEYLDDRYGAPYCLPQDASNRAYVRSLAQVIACDMHPLNNLRVLQFLKLPLAHTEEETLTWYHHWLTLGFEALETRIAQSDRSGKYCFGETPTLADMCLIPQIFNANRFGYDMQAYPTLMAINTHCLTLDCFQKAAAS